MDGVSNFKKGTAVVTAVNPATGIVSLALEEDCEPTVSVCKGSLRAAIERVFSLRAHTFNQSLINLREREELFEWLAQELGLSSTPETSKSF